MTLKLIDFKDIKDESQYIIRYEDWDNGLEVRNGEEARLAILKHCCIDEDEIEDYGGMENALDAYEERMGDGWEHLEVYEVIS
jgi:hypothetical protein